LHAALPIYARLRRRRGLDQGAHRPLQRDPRRRRLRRHLARRHPGAGRPVHDQLGRGDVRSDGARRRSRRVHHPGGDRALRVLTEVVGKLARRAHHPQKGHLMAVTTARAHQRRRRPAGSGAGAVAGGGSHQRRPDQGWTETRRATLAGYLFLSPWLLGFFGITALPMLGSLALSFTNFSGSFSRMEWVGLDNYRIMFTVDPAYWGSVRVTLLYVLLSVPAMLVFALTVATLLNKGIRALGIYRTVFYIPSLLGSSVAIAVLWRFVWG